jgi:hypothetical protein
LEATMELGRLRRTLMMMLLLRPPAAQRATGLRQQPDRNRLTLARRARR